MKWLLSLSVLAAGFLLLPRSAPAIPRYTTATGQQCLYCHVSMINKTLLNEAGEYYRKHHSFDGYQPKKK